MGRLTTSVRKVIFIGIDFHKRSSTVTLGDRDGNVVQQAKLINDEQILRKFFAEYRGAKCAVESSRAFEWLVELLMELGLEVVVCHPRQVKLIAETAFKTDKRDSKILMMLLAKDFLPTSYYATAEERALRERLRWRVQLVRTVTRTKLRIHALLDKEHKGWNKKELFSKAGREYMAKVQLSGPRRALLDKAMRILNFVEGELDCEERWIAEEVKRRPDAQLLMTAPGIGQLSALVLIAELGNVSRFRRAEQVPAYLGMVPRESSSADVRRLGKITKQGSGLVRWLLVQDAWRAVETDWQLKMKFAQVSKRRGRNVAVVGIARRLSEIAYCILRDKKPYSAERLVKAQQAILQ
jgi:transposase